MQPEYLYHFTKTQTAIEKILPSMQLLANDLSKTNDPRETYVWTFGGMNIGKEDEESDFELPFKLGYRVKQNCKVICFTKGPEAYKNEAMWTHYGQNHAGICLEIDKNRFIEENSKILDKYLHFFESVEYNTKNFKKPYFTRERKQDYDLALTNFIVNNNNYLFFQKSKYWENENEARLVVKADFDGLFSIKHSLIRIIIGIHCNENYLLVLEYLTKDMDAKIFQCIFGLNNFELTIQERYKGDYRPDIMKKYLEKFKL